MIKELKTFLIRCDRCPSKEVFQDAESSHACIDTLRERGWRKITAHGWGSTSYSQDELLCPYHQEYR